MRHTDATPGWIKRRFAKIEKQICEQAAARRMESATIGKGGLTVKNLGKIVAPYPTGGNAIYVGPANDGLDYYAVEVNTTAGVRVLQCRAYPPQTDAPDGFTVAGFTADILGLSSGSSITILMDTSEGVSIAHGETFVKSNGAVRLQGVSDGVQITHSTTGASANCFIDPSDSRIWRSTSSRRYKQDIEDAEVDPAEVLQLRPRTWRDKGEVENEPETTQRYAGLIAEEVDELPTMRQFVTRKDGEPEAVDYDRLSTVALLAVVKDLSARIEALESADEAPAEP